jgi:Zn-dependent protease
LSGLPILSPFAIIEAFIAFILAFSLHCATQALVAAMLGDHMPATKGRLSLLPTRHMTAIGTIVAIVTSFSVLAGLGWGKPIEIDARRLRVGPNLGTILVALSGPLVNLLLGLGVSAGLRLIPGYNTLGRGLEGCAIFNGSDLQNCLGLEQPWPVLRIEQFLIVFAVTNIVLALLNIIPLYPLDGYHVVFALLPTYQAIRFRNMIPYMEFILLVFFFVIHFLLPFFDPARFLADVAREIVNALAGQQADFYMLL